MCESGLSKTRRAVEQRMVKRLASEKGSLDVHPQVGYKFTLSGKIYQFLRADNSVQILIFAFVCISGIKL